MAGVFSIDNKQHTFEYAALLPDSSPVYIIIHLMLSNNPVLIEIFVRHTCDLQTRHQLSTS